MPRRLAITGLYEASILEYEDKPLAPNQVKVRTEIASGKHGTTFGCSTTEPLLVNDLKLRGMCF